MIVILKLVSLFLVIATVVPSAAHALEWPGKRRLAREPYLAVQPIYYPGFTIIGTAEPLSILALAVLLAVTPRGTAVFWLVAAALLAAVVTHALYWIVTAPVNKVWLRSETLSGAGRRFFAAGANVSETEWTALRDRWEHSHLYRASSSLVALILLSIAVVT